MYNCQREIYCYEIKQSVNDFHSKNKFICTSYLNLSLCILLSIDDNITSLSAFNSLFLAVFITLSETLVLNGQRIGCSSNSMSATVEELVGYIFIKIYCKERYWYHKPQTINAITKYWFN